MDIDIDEIVSVHSWGKAASGRAVV